MEVISGKVYTLADRWIPVSERMPAVAQKVLAFDPHMPIIQTGRMDADGKWNCEGLTFLKPSHWMPMPEPPLPSPPVSRPPETRQSLRR